MVFHASLVFYWGLTRQPLFFMQKGNDFMDITGLDIIQISQHMTTYVENHFKGFMLPQGDSLFQESYLLYFDEVKDTIPEQHHNLFNDVFVNIKVQQI